MIKVGFGIQHLRDPNILNKIILYIYSPYKIINKIAIL